MLSTRRGLAFTARNFSQADVRTRLHNSIKEAMKAKDTAKSTTFRSVLSEIQLADKASKEPLSNSGVLGIIRKAATRRKDAAGQYVQAGRQDLSQKELAEADLLSQFLPQLMTEPDVDNALRRVVQLFPVEDLAKKGSRGKILGQFYAQVDKTNVDPQMVNERLSLLLKH